MDCISNKCKTIIPQPQGLRTQKGRSQEESSQRHGTCKWLNAYLAYFAQQMREWRQRPSNYSEQETPQQDRNHSENHCAQVEEDVITSGEPQGAPELKHLIMQRAEVGRLDHVANV